MYSVSPAFTNLGSKSDEWLFTELQDQIATEGMWQNQPAQHREASNVHQTAQNIMALITELEKRGHRIDYP